jgi:flavorubredoxin
MNIKSNIHWIGYIDWDLRNFHGYSTSAGSTYNAYLIIDDQPTIIDSVKHYAGDELVEKIKRLIDPGKIKYIVSNHTEMDHSGAISRLVELCPQAQVVCSPKGQEGLRRHFKQDWKFKVVNSQDTINLGKYQLQFFLTPMVHWPDSMVTYLGQEKILFSNDAFGQHYAGFNRYVDQVGQDIIFREAAKYYANIVMPYGAQVLKALEALSGLTIEMICPSHGLIWRQKDDIAKILKLYKEWAEYKSENKAVIVYDTMWHSTQKIAKKLYDLLDARQIPVQLMNLQNTHISDIVTQIMLSRMVLAGSPMLNNHILPTMASLLTYIKGLKPKNRYAFTFGSYGWSKLGFKELEDNLQEAGMELLEPGRYFQYVPDQSELEQLDKVAEKIGGAMKV